MPCYLTGSAEGDARLSASESSAEVTKMADMLCRTCEVADGFDIDLPADVQIWWNNHTKIDAERIKREAEELEAVRARANALAKLTAHERKVLGL